MSRVFAVVNQKGGVGKSTTAEAMCAGLAQRGYAVLAVDLDAQGNLTYTFGAAGTTGADGADGATGASGATVLDALTGRSPAQDAIRHTPDGDILPSSRHLSGADAFLTQTGKEYRLREALLPVRDRYDFLVIDTPPALGILTVNALTACDSVIIPAQADIYSLQGIEQLAETIQPVRKYTNPSLSIAGILLTRYSPRSVLSREIACLTDRLAETLGTKRFQTTIREAVAVREAQLSRQPLFRYAPKAKVTQDYSRFLAELLGEE